MTNLRLAFADSIDMRPEVSLPIVERLSRFPAMFGILSTMFSFLCRGLFFLRAVGDRPFAAGLCGQPPQSSRKG